MKLGGKYIGETGIVSIHAVLHARVRSCVAVLEHDSSSFQEILDQLTLQLAVCPARNACTRIVNVLSWRNAVLVCKVETSLKKQRLRDRPELAFLTI